MKRFIRILFMSVLFLSGMALNGAAEFFEAGVQKLEVPIIAPDFSLRKLGGGEISLKELKGKVILLNFFAPWCAICRKQASSFDQFARDFQTQGVVFLFVAIKEDEEDLRKFKDEFKISIPILNDENGRVAKEYRVVGHHEIFFIDREGRIVGKSFGGIDWTSASMKQLLAHLLTRNK